MKIADAAQDVVRPAMPSECPGGPTPAMMMGYAGCYSSFLKHAEGHAEKLRRLRSGNLDRGGQPRKLVGGQEGPAHRHRAGTEEEAGRQRRRASRCTRTVSSPRPN